MRHHPKKIWDDSEVPPLREKVAAGLLSPRQIAADYHVSIETVRRMLRGETYFNLAVQPTKVEPSLEALAQSAADVLLAPGENALERFLRETQETREKSDKLIKEIFGEKSPSDSLPPAAEPPQDLGDPQGSPPAEPPEGSGF